MAGRKNNIKNYKSLVAGDMSQASLTSAVTDIQFLDNIGIQMNFSGSPVGNLQIQVSADHNQDLNSNVSVAGNWVPLVVNGSTAIPTSVGSPIYVDLNQLSAPYIRVVYTKVSGTGTLDVILTAKEI